MDKKKKRIRPGIVWLLAAGLWVITLGMAGSAGSMTDVRAAAPAEIELEDGEYQIEVTLAGGTGRAAVESPAVLRVKDRQATARICWSSPYYDYMVVEGQVYEPVSGEGNSVFEIPVTAWNTEMEVLADTTAMSEPHEIAYTLKFDTSTVRKRNGEAAGRKLLWAGAGAAVLAALLLLWGCRRKRARSA